MRRILALCAIALLAVLGLVACGKPAAGPTPTATSAATASSGATGASGTAPRSGAATAAAGPSRSAAPSNSAMPQRVLATLARIDAGTWPPQDGSGTQGGRNFGNFEGRLPATDAQGKRAKYTEWDVNVRKPGQSRDAERIITGADGSAWYTLNHYETFTRIR